MENKPVVTLNLADKRNQNIVWGININAYNKPELCRIITPLKRLMLQAEVKFGNDSVKAMKLLAAKLMREGADSLKKQELVDFMVSFCSDLGNIAALAEVDKRYKQLWIELITKDRVPFFEAKQILGKTPDVVTTTGWRMDIISQMMIFPAQLSRGEISYFSRDIYNADTAEFWIPQLIRVAAVKAFMGEDATYPRLSEQLPEGERLVVENFESSIGSDVAYMEGLNSAISLLGSSDNINASKLKQLAKTIPSGDFATDGQRGVPSRIELLGVAYMLLLIYNRTYREKIKTGDVAEFAKYVVNKMAYHIDGTIWQYFIPTFKGFKKSWTGDNRAGRIVSLINLLVAIADKEWMDMSNFILRYLCRDNIISEYAGHTGLFSQDSVRRNTLEPATDETTPKSRRNPYDTKTLKTIDWWNDIQLQFIANYLRMLCAIGVIEIAEDPASYSADNPMATIRYIRPTALGRYAFGLAKTYDAPEVKAPADQYDFDDDNLIVTVLSENSPFEVFLNKIGRRIGGHRYRVDAQTIIANSSDKEEVLKNIETFRNMVCKKADGVWAKMLDETQMRVSCQRREETEYLLLWLDKDVPGLIDFITGSEEIMKRCIKAEDCRLLVPEGFWPELQKLCHKAGYIL